MSRVHSDAPLDETKCVLCQFFPEQQPEHDRLHHKLDIQDGQLIELPIEGPPTLSWPKDAAGHDLSGERLEAEMLRVAIEALKTERDDLRKIVALGVCPKCGRQQARDPQVYFDWRPADCDGPYHAALEAMYKGT